MPKFACFSDPWPADMPGNTVGAVLFLIVTRATGAVILDSSIVDTVCTPAFISYRDDHTAITSQHSRSLSAIAPPLSCPMRSISPLLSSCDVIIIGLPHAMFSSMIVYAASA